MLRYNPTPAGPCCKGEATDLGYCTQECACFRCVVLDLFNDGLQIDPLTSFRVAQAGERDPLEGVRELSLAIYDYIRNYAEEVGIEGDDLAAALSLAYLRFTSIAAVMLHPDPKSLPCIDGRDNRLTSWDYPHGFNCSGCGYPSYEKGR